MENRALVVKRNATCALSLFASTQGPEILYRLWDYIFEQLKGDATSFFAINSNIEVNAWIILIGGGFEFDLFIGWGTEKYKF